MNAGNDPNGLAENCYTGGAEEKHEDMVRRISEHEDTGRDVPSFETAGSGKGRKIDFRWNRPTSDGAESPSRHYRYPTLGSDRADFVRARADPLACNLNNDMVLLWNDVTIEDEATGSRNPPSEESIEDAYQRLYSAAVRHREELRATLRDAGLEGVNSEAFCGDAPEAAESFDLGGSLNPGVEAGGRAVDSKDDGEDDVGLEKLGDNDGVFCGSDCFVNDYGGVEECWKEREDYLGFIEPEEMVWDDGLDLDGTVFDNGENKCLVEEYYTSLVNRLTDCEGEPCDTSEDEAGEADNVGTLGSKSVPDNYERQGSFEDDSIPNNNSNGGIYQSDISHNSINNNYNHPNDNNTFNDDENQIYANTSLTPSFTTTTNNNFATTAETSGDSALGTTLLTSTTSSRFDSGLYDSSNSDDDDSKSTTHRPMNADSNANAIIITATSPQATTAAISTSTHKNASSNESDRLHSYHFGEFRNLASSSPNRRNESQTYSLKASDSVFEHDIHTPSTNTFPESPHPRSPLSCGEEYPDVFTDGWSAAKFPASAERDERSYSCHIRGSLPRRGNGDISKPEKILSRSSPVIHRTDSGYPSSPNLHCSLRKTTASYQTQSSLSSPTPPPRTVEGAEKIHTYRPQASHPSSGAHQATFDVPLILSTDASTLPPNWNVYAPLGPEDWAGVSILPLIASPHNHDLPIVDAPGGSHPDLVKCHAPDCEKTAELDIARHMYKNCHNCRGTYYCGRACRRRDWPRHKRHVCHGSRVSSACKRLIRFCGLDPDVKAALSRLARRGYLSSGRGCVMLGFPDLSAAEEFMLHGFACGGSSMSNSSSSNDQSPNFNFHQDSRKVHRGLELIPVYVSLRELQNSKMFGGGETVEKLTRLGQTYDPGSKFLLNVGIGVRWNREQPCPGADVEGEGSPGSYSKEGVLEKRNSGGAVEAGPPNKDVSALSLDATWTSSTDSALSPKEAYRLNGSKGDGQSPRNSTQDSSLHRTRSVKSHKQQEKGLRGRSASLGSEDIGYGSLSDIRDMHVDSPVSLSYSIPGHVGTSESHQQSQTPLPPYPTPLSPPSSKAEAVVYYADAGFRLKCPILQKCACLRLFDPTFDPLAASQCLPSYDTPSVSSPPLSQVSPLVWRRRCGPTLILAGIPGSWYEAQEEYRLSRSTNTTMTTAGSSNGDNSIFKNRIPSKKCLVKEISNHFGDKEQTFHAEEKLNLIKNSRSDREKHQRDKDRDTQEKYQLDIILKARELCFANIQRRLRERGVSLRRQFPKLYAELADYVTGEVDHFPSRIIFPVSQHGAGRMFTCVLMPESEPDLRWTQSAKLLDHLDISRERVFTALQPARLLQRGQVQDNISARGFEVGDDSNLLPSNSKELLFSETARPTEDEKLGTSSCEVLCQQNLELNEGTSYFPPGIGKVECKIPVQLDPSNISVQVCPRCLATIHTVECSTQTDVDTKISSTKTSPDPNFVKRHLTVPDLIQHCPTSSAARRKFNTNFPIFSFDPETLEVLTSLAGANNGCGRGGDRKAFTPILLGHFASRSVLLQYQSQPSANGRVHCQESNRCPLSMSQQTRRSSMPKRCVERVSLVNKCKKSNPTSQDKHLEKKKDPKPVSIINDNNGPKCKSQHSSCSAGPAKEPLPLPEFNCHKNQSQTLPSHKDVSQILTMWKREHKVPKTMNVEPMKNRNFKRPWTCRYCEDLHPHNHHLRGSQTFVGTDHDFNHARKSCQPSSAAATGNISSKGPRHYHSHDQQQQHHYHHHRRHHHDSVCDVSHRQRQDLANKNLQSDW